MRLFVAIAAATPALVAASAGLNPSLDAGERAFQKCYSCHSITSDEKLDGPRLGGIVGGPVAARAGFDYSPAMKRFANRHPVWTEALLDRFIADPEAVVPGTSMAFAGVRDANERAQIIAYLRGVPDSGS